MAPWGCCSSYSSLFKQLDRLVFSVSQHQHRKWKGLCRCRTVEERTSAPERLTFCWRREKRGKVLQNTTMGFIEVGKNACFFFAWGQWCTVWLTSVIVEHCYTNYQTKTAEEEHWPCGEAQKRELLGLDGKTIIAKNTFFTTVI